jgi:hypothetical protein
MWSRWYAENLRSSSTEWVGEVEGSPKIIAHSPIFFFFFFFFQAGRTPLAWFSLLVLRCGSGCQIKAQAAARVGRSGISDGCFTAPEESAGRTPQLLSKGNIVIIRNRKRASLLCTCSAVLIYLDLRWNSEIQLQMQGQSTTTNIPISIYITADIDLDIPKGLSKFEFIFIFVLEFARGLQRNK